MAWWKSLPMPGAMVEVFSHRSPWCAALGHVPTWKTDQLVCGRHQCRQTFPASTKAVLAEFATLEGMAVVADELQRRWVEGMTTDSDPTGRWDC